MLQVQASLAFGFPPTMLTWYGSIWCKLSVRDPFPRRVWWARRRDVGHAATPAAAHTRTRQNATRQRYSREAPRRAETACTYRREQGANGTAASGRAGLHLLLLRCRFAFPGIELEPPKAVARSLQTRVRPLCLVMLGLILLWADMKRICY